VELKNIFKKLPHFIKKLIIAIYKNDLIGVSAEIAFFLVFSLFPIVISLVAVLSMIARNPDFYLNITSFIYDSLPKEVATFLNYNLRLLANSIFSGGALVLGFFITIWTSSNVMISIIKGINRAYHLEETRSFIKIRLLTLSLIFSIGFLLITAFALIVFGENFIEWIVKTQIGILPNDAMTRYNVLRWSSVSIILFALSSLLYNKAPNTKNRFIHVVPGAIFFSIFWIVFTAIFGYYLNSFPNYNATYGALTTLIVLLLWFYISAITFMIGAQINGLLFYEENKITLAKIVSDIKGFLTQKFKK
jgi:membrane protein